MEGRPRLSELKSCCTGRHHSTCGTRDAQPSGSAAAAPLVPTAVLLRTQACGAAGIPLDDVLRDDFGGQSRVRFLTKVDRGKIEIAVSRRETSRKAMVATGLVDLAASIDARVAAARQEFWAMSR